jgi:hypothetical protein
MMRAEAIAWLHGLVLLDALAAVSEDLQRVQSSPASGAAAGAAGAKGSKALSLAESKAASDVLMALSIPSLF